MKRIGIYINSKELEDLSPKVVKLDKKVSNIEKDIDNLKSNCGEFKQDIKEIRGARLKDYVLIFSVMGTAAFGVVKYIASLHLPPG
ncbi:hypothetical protein [Alkalimarinus coralli]|uniref:hypothetical protein n=1 Tax=Alkalimarinus coralli TaxID=2935863 RepID=UPI00202B05BD|nr:hypothetical protein [Alkalimarinus coralli]